MGYPGKAYFAIYAICFLLCLGMIACDQNVLDGVWRQEVGEEAPSLRTSYEIVLAQYGPDVAGTIWFYDQSSVSNTEDNPFGWPTFCRMLQRGRYHEDSRHVAFEFNDEVGTPHSVWLGLDKTGKRLVGTLRLGEEEESVPLRLGFSRISKDPFSFHLRGQCHDMSSVQITGNIAPGLAEDLVNPTMALVYIGTFLDQPFSFVALTVPLVNRRFSLVLSRKPPSKALTIDTPETSFGYAVFFLFDDLNGDGKWQRREWGGGDYEPAVGVGPHHAITWVEGRVEPHFPDLATSLVELPQGYSLVHVQEDVSGNLEFSPIQIANGKAGEDVIIEDNLSWGVPDIFERD